jgi:hypothetical protein
MVSGLREGKVGLFRKPACTVLQEGPSAERKRLAATGRLPMYLMPNGEVAPRSKAEVRMENMHAPGDRCRSSTIS